MRVERQSRSDMSDGGAEHIENVRCERGLPEWKKPSHGDGFLRCVAFERGQTQPFFEPFLICGFVTDFLAARS